MLRSKPVQLAVLLLAVFAAYANHFHNSFHFDDSHTVSDNPAIRSLRNLPLFFTDVATFSVLPANRTYRPMVSASLALDYALGHGYDPFWFHLSTFLVFLAQLIAMYAVFAAILNTVRPASQNTNHLVALAAAAWYGLHPAMAETVNYVIQRGDIFCAFGVVAALAVYQRWPRLRKTGIYLLPFAFALLSKPPAVVFPILLFFYIAIFEREGKRRILPSALASLPSLAVCILLMALQSAMTPKTYLPSTLSTYAYCITQPYVLLRYFCTLFLPIHLNADTDLQAFASLTPEALLGFIFVGLLLTAVAFTLRRKTLQPIGYGLLWFFITSLPTSLYKLSEVENDHRMFLPFVGLVLAVAWAVYLWIEQVAVGEHRTAILRCAAIATVVVLALYGYGVHLRNKVWHTEETLWLDDVQKSPLNGRGWMNYGLTQMAKGAYPVALSSFERALMYTPNYRTLEINLGVVHGAMHHPAEAEQHFLRAISLSATDEEAHFFYGRWLYQNGRIGEAITQLKTSVQLNPLRLAPRELLAQAYAAMGDSGNACATAAEALSIDPTDTAAKAILAHPAVQDADTWINASLYRYRAGDYAGCIEDARKALKLKPESALAYNNIAAGSASLGKWDDAIVAAKEAIRIDPSFQLAKNNLAWAQSEKKTGVR